MKGENRGRDERITVRSSWQRDFLILFLVLLIVNGGYMLIYMTLFSIEPSLENLLVPELISFLIFTTLILCSVTGLMRHFTFDRPMQKLSSAARSIAAGDFSVRIPPTRRDGKKDYVEVMYEDFNTMAEELSGIETLKNEFIANVSHEIKTPLAIIQSYATALQQHSISEEERSEYTQTIIEASRKLSALVTNILKLNKLENQEIVSEAEPFDLSEQLRYCALSLEELWERKDIRFEADIEDGVIINYDADMLEIVWNNLLSNAIKFTDVGGRARLSLRVQEGFAVVSVSDTGCGMDESIGSRIFDKFYQGDTSHSQEGNGLGLALVKRVVQMVQGGIAVDSHLGEGTTFTVHLKLK